MDELPLAKSETNRSDQFASVCIRVHFLHYNNLFSKNFSTQFYIAIYIFYDYIIKKHIELFPLRKLSIVSTDIQSRRRCCIILPVDCSSEDIYNYKFIINDNQSDLYFGT